MALRSYSPIFLGFVAAVFLTQNLVLGYCATHGAYFFSHCPSSQRPASESECCCSEASCCGENGDCCRFLNLELDDFLEVVALPALSEAPSVPLAREYFRETRDRIVPEKAIRALPIRAGPPPGVPILLRFSVALI